MNNTFYIETGWWDRGPCEAYACNNVSFRHRVYFSHESAGDMTLMFCDSCVEKLRREAA